MLSRPTVIAGVVLVVSLWLQAECVFGQNVIGQRGVAGQRGVLPGQGNQQMNLTPVNIDGTVTGMAGGVILVNDKNTLPWKVTVHADATIHVTGTATVEYLKTGLTLDFKADFDDKGVIKEKVSELSIVSATAEPPGIVVGGGDDAAANADAGGKSAKHPAAKGAGKSGAAKGVAPAGSNRVVGKLSVKPGKYTVQAHGISHPIELPLADEVTIKVDLAELSLAAAGDNITVSGMGTHPRVAMGARGASAAPGVVQATDVKIEMAEQLTGPKRKTPSGKSGSHPKKDKEDSAPP